MISDMPSKLGTSVTFIQLLHRLSRQDRMLDYIYAYYIYATL